MLRAVRAIFPEVLNSDLFASGMSPWPSTTGCSGPEGPLSEAKKKPLIEDAAKVGYLSDMHRGPLKCLAEPVQLRSPMTTRWGTQKLF